MRSLVGEVAVWRRPPEPQRRIIATEHAGAPAPTPQQMLFEVGVTLAAALSVALAGNFLATWVGG
jgi:hypothetical protein